MEIPVTEARAQFAELINRVGYGGEEVVLTRHGKPLVALVPAAYLEPGPDPARDVVLDMTAHRETDQSSFRLAAQDRSAPPRAGS